jgi:hypothetical protein
VKLGDTQARFAALVTARDSVAEIAARDATARAAVDAMIVGDAGLSAIERLDVYASMYFVRIHDVLRGEYARTAAVVGGEAFHGLVTDYLQACPPGHPSLREAGARLPGFLAGHALGGARPWLAELARLERARLEVFDGPDATPLSIAALSQLPAERFGGLRLALVPSHRVLAGRFAIAEIWRADDPSTVPPRETPETLIVWRREGEVFHRPADADEAHWFPRLSTPDGVAFEVVCAQLAETRGLVGSAARAFELLARWAGEALVTAS